jgi:hypothetical protein
MDVREWNDIAYSFAVSQSGRIFECRGWGNRTAANGTATGNAAGEAGYWMGGLNQTPTDEAIDAMGWLTRQAVERGRTLVVPHSHWKTTACPGDDWRQLITEEFWMAQFTDAEAADLRHLLTRHKDRFILGEHVDEVVAQDSSGKGIVSATLSMWRGKPWEAADEALEAALADHTHPPADHSHDFELPDHRHKAQPSGWVE